MTQEPTDATPVQLSRAQRELLLKLARGPTQPGFADTALAEALVALGLARLDSRGARRAYFEITPVGRRTVALSGAVPPTPGETPKPRRTRLQSDLSSHRATVATVARMQAAGWRIATCCLKCDGLTLVDLDLLVWRHGGRTVLWDHPAKCLRPGCGGQAPYQARRPGDSLYQPLRTTPG